MWIVILPKFRLSQVDLCWQAVFSVYMLPAKMLECAVTRIFAFTFLVKTVFVIVLFDIRHYPRRLNSLSQ